MDDAKVAKLQKVLYQAERAGTPEEAETFYAMAQELMAKWSIDAAMLAASRTTTVASQVARRITKFNKSKIWRNHANLLWAIARANDVKAVLCDYSKYKGMKPEMHIIGFDHDLDTVEMLFTSMMIQCSRERNRMVPPEIKKSESLRGPWFRSFIDAYASRIEDRLREVRRSAQVGYGQEKYGASMLPVLAAKSEKIQEEFDKLFPSTSTARASRARWSSEGASRGREAADRADIPTKGSPKTGELPK